jgi:N,N'-diacetylchitobiose transport system permease protein
LTEPTVEDGSEEHAMDVLKSSPVTVIDEAHGRRDEPPAMAPLHRGRRLTKKKATPYLLATPAILLLFGLLAYPLFRMTVLSFQNMRLRHLIRGETPPWAGFDNYTRVFSDPFFWTVVRNTVVFTVVAVSLSVLLGLLVALLMRRVSPWVRITMVIAMMLVWAMPQLIQAQIFKWMVDADFGVLNYLIDKIPGVNFFNHSWWLSSAQGWTVITALVVWGGIPFLAVTLFAGLSQVPRDLVEAATVDGANAWQVFRNVTLPILRPLIVIVTTLSVIWDFQVFTQIWVLRDSKPEREYLSLSVYAYTESFGRSNYSLGSAIALITVVLMLGVMAFYIRQMFKIGDVD